MTPETTPQDTVNTLLKACVADKELAKKVCEQVIVNGSRSVTLPEGDVTLSEAERGEFAERFSAEVEPMIWTSKRAKE